MLRQFRNGAVIVVALASASCGIKGPLVLPPATPATVAPPATTPPVEPGPSSPPPPGSPTTVEKKQ
jgi:predicted small lipoprotein YifL